MKKVVRVKALRCIKECGLAFAAADRRVAAAARREHFDAVHAKSGQPWPVWRGRSD